MGIGGCHSEAAFRMTIKSPIVRGFDLHNPAVLSYSQRRMCAGAEQVNGVFILLEKNNPILTNMRVPKPIFIPGHWMHLIRLRKRPMLAVLQKAIEWLHVHARLHDFLHIMFKLPIGDVIAH